MSDAMPGAAAREKPEDLDFSVILDPQATFPEPAHTDAELRNIDDLGVIGASELKTKGFYARIVNAETRGAPKVAADTTVLVVEDDQGTAGVILKVLQSQGYQTRHASDLGEIASALRRLPLPDIMLLDVLLPKANGFDILNRIRQHPVLQSMPVIMLTSLGERSDIARGLSLGADGYLTKPALPSTLLDALQALTGADGAV